MPALPIDCTIYIHSGCADLDTLPRTPGPDLSLTETPQENLRDTACHDRTQLECRNKDSSTRGNNTTWGALRASSHHPIRRSRLRLQRASHRFEIGPPFHGLAQLPAQYLKISPETSTSLLPLRFKPRLPDGPRLLDAFSILLPPLQMLQPERFAISTPPLGAGPPVFKRGLSPFLLVHATEREPQRVLRVLPSPFVVVRPPCLVGRALCPPAIPDSDFLEAELIGVNHGTGAPSRRSFD